MNEPNNKPEEENGVKESLGDRIGGLGQKIIGEVEMLGGILTADPNTAAEGEFNLEVGELRSEVEDDLDSSKPPNAADDAGVEKAVDEAEEGK